MANIPSGATGNSYPDYLRQFQGYLNTRMDISSIEATQKEAGRQQTLSKVKVIVSNNAPAVPDCPRIVFMGVGLSVTYLGEASGNPSPSQWRIHRLEPEKTTGLEGLPWQGDDKFKRLWERPYNRINGQDFPEATPDERAHGEVLFPGQSIIFEVDVLPQVVPCLQFRVEGTVSRRHLFHHQETLVMPEALTKPVAVAAFSDLNGMELHRVLDSVLVSMPAFNGDTRLAEVQAFSATLTKGIADIKVSQEAVNKMWREHKMFWFQAHLRAAYICLDRVSAALARMREAIGSSGTDRIAAEASALLALGGEAGQFNRMTEELMRRHNVSDNEVDYKYRGR